MAQEIKTLKYFNNLDKLLEDLSDEIVDPKVKPDFNLICDWDIQYESKMNLVSEDNKIRYMYEDLAQDNYNKLSALNLGIKEDGWIEVQDKNRESVYRCYEKGVYRKFKIKNSEGNPEIIDYLTHDLKREKREYYDSKGYVRKVEYMDDENKPCRVTYLDSDGECYLSETISKKTNKVTKLNLFDSKNLIFIDEFNSREELILYWINNVVSNNSSKVESIFAFSQRNNSTKLDNMLDELDTFKVFKSINFQDDINLINERENMLKSILSNRTNINLSYLDLVYSDLLLNKGKCAELIIFIESLTEGESNLESLPKTLLNYYRHALEIKGELDEKQNYFLKYYLEQINENELKPNLKKKLVNLFNNGESRIDLYKSSQTSKTVVFLFDTINISWDKEPFAFKFINKFDVDIICLRRRRLNSYHQDLSKEEFVQIVSGIMNNYDRKLAYGFSLGGYTSLYYAAHLGCEILSLSPRVSGHPHYGGKPKSNDVFIHDLNFEYNDKLKPIIVYDPRDPYDNPYVEDVILPAFPNAKLIKTNFSGHDTAPHLQRLGYLRPLVTQFILNKELPGYNNRNKSKSSIYLKVLARHCYLRGKLKWAESLIIRSLELDPKDEQSKNLKKSIMKKSEELIV